MSWLKPQEIKPIANFLLKMHNMKPLNEFTNEDKIKFLFQLFPEMIQPTREATIHFNECVQKLKPEAWNNGFMTLEYWQECSRLATQSMNLSRSSATQ